MTSSPPSRWRANMALLFYAAAAEPRLPDNAATLPWCSISPATWDSIVEIDPERRIARVQPGVVLDNLRNAAEKHHLTFAPDPATHRPLHARRHDRQQLLRRAFCHGGQDRRQHRRLSISSPMTGLRMKVGKTSDERAGTDHPRRRPPRRNLRRPEKTAATSTPISSAQRYPDIPRRVSGYNLNFLLPENGFDVARALVGSEGTCVSVLEATCRLVESPPARVLLLIAYPDIFQCADHVPDVMAHKPIGLEGIDDLLVEYTRRRGINSEGLALLPEGGGWLLAEFGADTIAAAEAQASGLMEALNRSPEPAQHAPVHRSRADQAGLGSARVQPGSNFLRPRRGLDLGRLGRLGRCSGKTWQISARPAPADEQLQLSRHALRTLWPRLRP